MNSSNLASSALPLATAMVSRSALERAVTIATNVVEKRNTYPILANLRLQGDGDNLFVTGTDLDIELVVAIPAPADSAFDVTLPAHMLAAIMKGAPAAEFVGFTRHPETKTKPIWEGDQVIGEEVIEGWSNDIIADFESASYNLAGLDSSNFPALTGPGWRPEGSAPGNFDGVYRFTMSGKDFYDLFDAVKYAISSEETRYYLNGVFFHVVGDNLVAVTTDGHRLAKQEYPAPMGAEGMPGVIVPKKTVALLEKLMRGKKCPGAVRVEVADETEYSDADGNKAFQARRVRFQFDDVTITSKVIDGTFPDYQRVIPKNHEKHATFPIAAMVKKIGAVAAIASDRGGKAVKVAFENSACVLSTINPDVGTARAEFPVERDFDTDFEIGFNVRYLLDNLSELAAGGDTVTIALGDAGAPAVMTGGKEGFLTVLMPMRV